MPSKSALRVRNSSPAARGRSARLSIPSHSRCWTAAIQSQKHFISFLAPEGIEGIRMEKLTLRMKKLNSDENGIEIGWYLVWGPP
jgi:hypothetical protein